MIELIGVSKSYKKPPVKALDGVSFAVADGEIFAFLGQNGAGKTTAVKLICGIFFPDGGTVLIDGISAEENPVEIKRRLSLVADESSLPERFTGNEFLRFTAQAYGVPVPLERERTAHYAQLFGMENMLSKVISSYSHGMRQKLRILASLLSDPQNWILDEPLSGLDPEAAFTLKQLMKERAQNGKTVFFSTHVMEVAEKLCDRVGILRRGALLFTGNLGQLRTHYASQNGSGKNPSLETIFLSLQ